MLMFKVSLELFTYIVLCSCSVHTYRKFQSNTPCDENTDLSLDGETEKAVKSVFACAVLCTEMTGCGGFLYYEGTKACYGVNAESPMFGACALPGTSFYKDSALLQSCDAGNSSLVADLPDGQFTASSRGSSNHWPHFAKKQASGAWRPDQHDTNPYIQVDFTEMKTVVSISTRGNGPVCNCWVKTYKVLISSDCSSFEELTDAGGEAKIFVGNTDVETWVSNDVTPAVNARCVRIRPVTWSNYVSLELDIIGC